MTTTNDKVRSVSLAALLVLSVFAGSVAFVGSAAAANSAQAAGADEAADSGTTYWAGMSLWIDAGNDASDQTWQIREATDSNNVGDLVTEFTLNETGEAVVSTSDLSGDYVIVDNEGTVQNLDSGTPSDDSSDDPVANSKWEVASQSFSASVNSTNVTTAQDVSVSVDSNRGSYEVEVTSDSLSADDLDTLFGDINTETTDDGVIVPGSADATVAPLNFAEAGEYTLDMSVLDTDASASVSVNVSAEGDAIYSLTDSFPSDERGDVGEFTVELENTDNAYVQFGSSDVNYAVAGTVTDGNDDGEVTVEVHTYNTDGDAGTVLQVDSDSDDSISGQDYVDNTSALSEGVIQAGDYGITVFGSESGEEQTFGTFVLNERSTDGAQSWVAPGSATFDDASDVYSSVSEGDSVAKDDTNSDTAVVQVQASGLYDYFESADDLGTENGLSVDITQTNPQANAEAEEIAAENYDVVTDSANNTFFLLVDVGSDNVEAGQNYEATFSVNGENNTIVADDTTQSVNTTFSVVERSVSFDTNRGDMYAVPNGEVNVTGTSTLAPGSEFTVNARSSAANLLKSQQVTVDSDGTWSAAFDFNDIDNGTEFTFTNKATDNSVDAMVDENVEAGGGQETTTNTTTTTTTTTTETTTTTTETTTTTTTTEEPTETTTESDGGIPGFGIGVALVAFVAAALLALRRSN